MSRTHTAHLNFSCTCGCTCTCKGTYADAKTIIIILTELLEMQAQGAWSSAVSEHEGSHCGARGRGERGEGRGVRLSVIARDLNNLVTSTSPLTNRTEQSRNPSSNPVVQYSRSPPRPCPLVSGLSCLVFFFLAGVCRR